MLPPNSRGLWSCCLLPTARLNPRDLLNPRLKSLVRANLIVLVSFGLAVLISHAPQIEPSAWLILPLLGSLVGTADTTRCMQRRWSFYHGGVILCLYMDLMIVTMILFFLLYPYFIWFSTTH